MSSCRVIVSLKARRRPVSGSVRLGLLELQVHVELGAAPAERIEVERARPLQAEQGRGAVEIARRLAGRADRDDVDHVGDPPAVEPRRRRAPGAEVAGRLDLRVPALRRHQVGVAGIGGAAADVRRSDEIEEVELAHDPLEPGADVPARRRPPGEVEEALGPVEGAVEPAGALLHQVRIFAAGRQPAASASTTAAGRRSGSPPPAAPRPSRPRWGRAPARNRRPDRARTGRSRRRAG